MLFDIEMRMVVKHLHFTLGELISIRIDPLNSDQILALDSESNIFLLNLNSFKDQSEVEINQPDVNIKPLQMPFHKERFLLCDFSDHPSKIIVGNSRDLFLIDLKKKNKLSLILTSETSKKDGSFNKFTLLKYIEKGNFILVDEKAVYVFNSL